MDSINYEQRFPIHNQRYPRAAYWPPAYTHAVPPSREQSNYTTSSVPQQISNFLYEKAIVVARPIMPPEWALSLQEQHQRQQQHSHHNQKQQHQSTYIHENLNSQYAKPIPASGRPAATTFLQQRQAPPDHDIGMTTPRGSQVLPCTETMKQITYYGPHMNTDLVSYPTRSNSQPSELVPHGLATSAPDTSLEHSPTASGDNSPQITKYPCARTTHAEVSHAPLVPSLSLVVPLEPVETYLTDAPISAGTLSTTDDEQDSHRSSPTPTPGPGHSHSHSQSHIHVVPQHDNMVDQSNTVSSPPSSTASPDETCCTSETQDSSNSTIVKRQGKSSTQLVPIKKEGLINKRVGKRNGPLRPDQRKQAGEIRKLRACIRCRYLKKTCDTGVPCNGCQPHHARLWQVPCTRLSIQDLGYFAKDWKADYERTGQCPGIVPYSNQTVWIWVSHGFGKSLAVSTRRVYVTDGRELLATWKEGVHPSQKEFKGSTASLQALAGTITQKSLSFYVDQHIDVAFERFVDEHFEGTRFITEILMTVYRYYRSTHLIVVRKALKLVVAYNLTMHITMIQHAQNLDSLEGVVQDSDSKNCGRILAPHLVNTEIKLGLARMWRELMKDVLSELAKLYTSVYSGDKLKNWVTIFMLDSVLLAVWEEMQFDANYMSMDENANKRFCEEMESTPVGVIVGLFAAISQKMPSFLEWDSEKHHHILNSDEHACKAMTEVREHVKKHSEYLRRRSSCVYDRDDFDSLANKFVSRLVVRAN